MSATADVKTLHPGSVSAFRDASKQADRLGEGGAGIITLALLGLAIEVAALRVALSEEKP